VATEKVTRTPGRQPDGDRPTAHALRVSALVALYVYLAALVVGPQGFRFWREWGLQNIALTLICAYFLVMIRDRPQNRPWQVPLAWWPLSFLVGNLLLNAHLSADVPKAVEGPAIGVMLTAYPFALVAIVQIHRGRWAAFTRAAVLDSLVAALAIWATFMAFVLPPALDAARKGGVHPLLVLAFPICDLTVLSCTVAAVALSGARPERMSGWLILAIVIFGLADSTYGIMNALGTWKLGTVMDGTWVVGVALVGLGAGAGPPSTRTTRTWGAGVLIVPLASAAVALCLLVIGNRWPLAGIAITLATASAVVALLRLADAYAQVRALAETERLATTDDLTGLANRRAFYRGVGERLTRQRPFALMLIDLDRFKEINDTLGHGVGDELLHWVARRLESGMPEAGLLARLGGDEFAVCIDLPVNLTTAKTSTAAAVAAAEHLLATLRGPIVVGGRMLAVGASLGAAVYPFQAETRTELMRQADVAMYAAKRAGGGVRVHLPGDDALLVLPGRHARPPRSLGRP
jgi:diguanylate cyclase (GGDEF)-like protein